MKYKKNTAYHHGAETDVSLRNLKQFSLIDCPRVFQ